MPRSYRRSWRMLFLIGAWVGAAVAARAADEASPAAAASAKPATDPMSPPEIVKPIIPGKAELAESAFNKLDPTGKGYVTLEDTKELAGFEQAFRVADTDHTGKLDLKEFRKAWADYSGYRDKE